MNKIKTGKGEMSFSDADLVCVGELVNVDLCYGMLLTGAVADDFREKNADRNIRFALGRLGGRGSRNGNYPFIVSLKEKPGAREYAKRANGDK